MSKSFPIYLEGAIAYSRYDPEFVATNGTESRSVPARWNTVSATGGIGWDFPLTENKELVFRPIFNISLGYVASDLSVAKFVTERITDRQLNFLDHGTLSAYGLGGSVMLDWEHSRETHEVDVELRYTNIHLQSFGGSANAVQGSASAQTANLYARWRAPTGLRALDRPVRYVLELSHSRYLGSQSEILGFTNLTTLGTGLELDTSARLRAWAYAGMQRILEAHLLSRTSRGFDWTGTAYHLARQLVQLLALCLFTLLLYLWLIFVLERFPASQPMGSRLGAFLLGMLNRIALACVEALPGIITAIVIFLITRAVHAMVNNIFAAAVRGRLDLPGLHQETAGATRRVVVLLVWALGFVFAYPYLPGSQSDVFKGLSVLFGFMITLGSAGIVNQLMSGMVVIYSRALKRGDFVALGENTGTVVSIDTLSVKLVNVRNEEITIPYALVVASPIVNYTRHAGDRGALVATTVTIGYDTPWRQVHAMLLAAASRMKHVAMTPAPFVVQRALSDYYVEYELMVAIADPTLRPLALSSLHAEIQDEFNRNGVQIMSPHFMAQPEEPVLVKPGQWQGSGHGGT